MRKIDVTSQPLINWKLENLDEIRETEIKTRRDCGGDIELIERERERNLRS